MGDALLFVGLFRDPDLPGDSGPALDGRRVQENYEAAVLRWREFLEKGVRSQAEPASPRNRWRCSGRRGGALRSCSRSDAGEPRRGPARAQPPNRVVGRLLQLPEWTHDRAEAFYADVRAGRVDYEPPAEPRLYLATWSTCWTASDQRPMMMRTP